MVAYNNKKKKVERDWSWAWPPGKLETGHFCCGRTHFVTSLDARETG